MVRVPHVDQIVQGVEVHLTRPVRKPSDARREGRVPGDIRLREIVPGVQRRRLVRVEPADARRHDRVLALHQADDLDARLAHVGLDHLGVVRRRLRAVERLVRVLVGVVEPQVANGLKTLPADLAPSRRAVARFGVGRAPQRRRVAVGLLCKVRERVRVVHDLRGHRRAVALGRTRRPQETS